MKDVNVFFSSGDGTLKTTTSSFYYNQAVVEELVQGQNAKAVEMGLKVTYQLSSCLKSDLPSESKVRN